MEPGYWIVLDQHTKERDVVLVDEEGDIWAPGCDFPCTQDQYMPIRKVNLED